MAKKSIYEIHVWSTLAKGGSVSYHSHLICKVPKENIIFTAVHKSRQGRAQHVKKILLKYPGAAIVQLGRKKKK